MLYRLDMKSTEPLYEQIINQTKAFVVRGLLRPGDKVMSVRELAMDLVINPNTVSKAYQELERLGILEVRRGRGTFVSEAWSDNRDAKRLADIEEQVRKLVVDSRYAGMTLGELLERVKHVYEEGEGHADGSPVK